MFSQVIEAAELLDSAVISGKDVVGLLKERGLDLARAKSRELESKVDASVMFPFVFSFQ